MDLWHLLIGRPLRRREAAREEITAPEGLAALSLDALTSVAYGPQAIVVVLATAGTAALAWLVPITVAIVGLLAILVLSYSQVIDAYPGGGGAYAVSRANLGRGWSLLAAASLIVDYVLTVAVSIAAGVAALVSAFPALLPATVPLCLGLLALLTLLNLRGVGESARAFLLPTAVFIGGILAVIAVGLWRLHASGASPAPGNAPLLPRGLGLLLLLKAFSAGCSALTGVEAIANGVPLFRPPRAVRAKRTEWLLGILLGTMLLGLSLLVRHFAVVPRPAATVLSQVMVDAVGRSWLYYVVTLAITTTLGLAANTSFGGLPVLLSLLARDGYVPHVFALRGDRLVFQHGIWALAVLAGVLLAAVGGNTDALIPLYAIGVFIGFTLSQAGLVRHWARTRPAGWGVRAAINAVGATASGLAAAVFLLTKFAAGAWVVACAVPALIGLFRRVHRYYLRLEGVLARDRLPPPPARRRTLVIVPVREVSLLTATAISDALSFGDEVVAVTVEFVEEGSGASTADELRQRWEEWAPGVRLVTLRSQYHSVVRPLLRFILTVDRGRHERVMVLIPDVVPRSPWGQLLHDQLGLMLAAALRQRTDVLVCLLPYHPLAAPAPAPQPSAPSGAPEPATGPSAPG